MYENNKFFLCILCNSASYRVVFVRYKNISEKSTKFSENTGQS